MTEKDEKLPYFVNGLYGNIFFKSLNVKFGYSCRHTELTTTS